jgi:hypothetical protein
MNKLDDNDLVEYGLLWQINEGMGSFGMLISSLAYLAVAVLLFAVGGALILTPLLELFNAIFA